MKYIKTYEKLEGPKINDYVLIDNGKIGKIIEIVVSSSPWGDDLYNISIDSKRIFAYYKYELIYWSSDKEDCEMYLNTKKYNFMITRFKIFEEAKQINTYFFIPYDDIDLIRASIKKLNITKALKDKILSEPEFWEQLEVILPSGKQVVGCYIIILSQIGTFGYWICDTRRSTKEEALDWFYNHHMIDGGVVELEDWEISSNKYNI